MNDTVHIVESDPRWPECFALETARIRGALPRDLSCILEHFGSTAVAGLAAKPVLDIFALVSDTSRWPALEPPLTQLGYALWRDNPDTDRHLYIKRSASDRCRTHHLHVRVPADAERELRFRDLLRSDQELRNSYAALKLQLALQYKHDRGAYSDGKTAFIEAALRGSP